jgi:hypothetical protein
VDPGWIYLEPVWHRIGPGLDIEPYAIGHPIGSLWSAIGAHHRIHIGAVRLDLDWHTLDGLNTYTFALLWCVHGGCK